jgi:hypothetical protein
MTFTELYRQTTSLISVACGQKAFAKNKYYYKINIHLVKTITPEAKIFKCDRFFSYMNLTAHATAAAI